MKNKYYIPDNLLTYENAKTTKGEALGVMTGILYLAPGSMSGVNFCPAASTGCLAACLFTAGRGAFSNVHNARMNKSHYFNNARAQFIEQLRGEIGRAKKRAKLHKMQLAIRLNGTSDLCFELISDLMTEFSDVQFYDYTKILARLKKPLPKNYDLTFSRSESNDADCIEALKLGFRVAVVISDIDRALDFFAGHTIVDGDLHDIRFLDAPGVIVVLKAKGRARKDQTNFVIREAV